MASKIKKKIVPRECRLSCFSLGNGCYILFFCISPDQRNRSAILCSLDTCQNCSFSTFSFIFYIFFLHHYIISLVSKHRAGVISAQQCLCLGHGAERFGVSGHTEAAPLPPAGPNPWASFTKPREIFEWENFEWGNLVLLRVASSSAVWSPEEKDNAWCISHRVTGMGTCQHLKGAVENFYQ